MRILTVVAIVILGCGCANTRQGASQPNGLNGTWIPVMQEMGGKPVPEAVYKTQRLIIRDSNYTLVAESLDKGVVKYSGNRMDIYGKTGVNGGKHFTAIYKYEQGQLTICYNLQGTDYPATFATTGQPLFFLSVFKKQP